MPQITCLMIVFVCTLFEIPSVALAIISLASPPPHRVAPLSPAPPLLSTSLVCPTLPRTTPEAQSTRPRPPRRCRTDQKLKKKYEAAAARVARWEAWAVELRDGWRRRCVPGILGGPVPRDGECLPRYVSRSAHPTASTAAGSQRPREPFPPAPIRSLTLWPPPTMPRLPAQSSASTDIGRSSSLL